MQRASFIALALLGASSCVRHNERVAPDTTRIEGVSARFEVPARVRRGDRLKVTAFYRNESDKTVVFYCTAAAIYDSRIRHGNVDKTTCMMVVEMPRLEMTLKPGEERRVPDELPLESNCWDAGDYEIRFYYDLSLLPDPSLRTQYASTHSVHDGAIPWESHGHEFIVK